MRSGSLGSQNNALYASGRTVQKHSKRDWSELAWVAGISLAVLVITQLPYLVAHLAPSNEMVFSGGFANIEDTNSYFAKIRQGLDGNWLFQNRYTPEPHRAGPLFIFYIALGQAAAVLHLSPQVIFAWARIVCDLILLATLYWFISLFVSPRRRRTAFLMGCFSSGLGWLLLLCGQTTVLGDQPVDLWVPEAITFYTLMISPHSALSTSLMLVSLGCLALSLRRESWKYAGVAAVATFALTWILPFAVAVVYAVAAAYVGWRTVERRAVPWAMIAYFSPSVAVSLPVLVYLQFSVVAENPVFRAWSAQNDCISPNPLAYIIGYGLILVLAVAGVRRVYRGQESIDPLPLCWAGTAALLLYVPLAVQRRFTQGLHIPLCLLATLAWTGTGLWKSQHRRLMMSGLRATLIIGLVTTNLFLWIGALSIATRAPYPFFIHKYEVEAMAWLSANTEPEDTVLCSWDTGSFVPAWAGNRVVIGHWAETVDVAEKKREVERFFERTTPSDVRGEIVQAYGIRYLFYGPNERGLGDYEPDADPLWESVFANDQVQIYRLVKRQ